MTSTGFVIANMPKMKRASPTSPPPRAKKHKAELIYVLRWARCTGVSSWEHESLSQVEWCSGEWSEIHSCVKEELDSVIKDAQGTIGAYRAQSDALRARDKLMHEKIAEARSAVRKNAYGMSPRTWKKLLETDWVTERSDVRDLGEGIEYNEGLSGSWVRDDDGWLHPSTASTFTFHDAVANARDSNQAHYHLCWGSLDGVERDDPMFKVESNEIINCCEEIDTRIRCWVEPVAIVPK